MRTSLVSVILGSFLFLAGFPGLADNQSAASKPGGSPVGITAPSGNQAPPAVNHAPEKEAAGKAPGTAGTPASSTSPGATPSQGAAQATSAASATAPGSDSGTATSAASGPAPSSPSSATVPSTGSAAVAPADATALEPHKRPVPEGYAAAAELFKQRKFPQAEKEFEKIVQGGTADVNTHLCLAHCFLQQKIYSKAVKEFEWLAKYAKNSMTLQKSCEQTARSLRNAMNGMCPANCLKITDPRWTMKDGAKVIRFPHSGGGYDTFTLQNLGQLVVYEHGNAVLKGVCPVCEGTTHVPVLKDGGPMPRI